MRSRDANIIARVHVVLLLLMIVFVVVVVADCGDDSLRNLFAMVRGFSATSGIIRLTEMWLGCFRSHGTVESVEGHPFV